MRLLEKIFVRLMTEISTSRNQVEKIAFALCGIPHANLRVVFQIWKIFLQLWKYCQKGEGSMSNLDGASTIFLLWSSWKWKGGSNASHTFCSYKKLRIFVATFLFVPVAAIIIHVATQVNSCGFSKRRRKKVPSHIKTNFRNRNGTLIQISDLWILIRTKISFLSYCLKYWSN